MVRLRLGRFAWELYYTETKAVLPHQDIKRRAGLVLGHLGYITGMGEYAATDMFWMRLWACCGCCGIVGYQLVQPKIQMPSVVWNSIFIGINVFQIYLLKKAPPVFEDDEADLWTAVRPHLTIHHVIMLLNLGEFRPFEAKTKLFEQSRRSPEDEVYVLTSGTCEVRVDGICVHRLGPGSIIGEVDMLRGDLEATSIATVVAVGDDVRCFCLNCAELRERLDRDLKLKGAVQGMFAESMLEKVLALNAKCDILQYVAVLELARDLPDNPGLTAALDNFRQRHSISSEEHARVSLELLRYREEQQSQALAALNEPAQKPPEPRPVLDRRNSSAVIYGEA